MIIDAPHPDNGGEWWIGNGADSEAYESSFSSRIEAINYGLGEGYDVFHIVQATQAVPRSDIKCHEIVDLFDQRNADCWGEDGMDMKEPSEEVEKELEDAVNQVVEAWLEKHGLRPEAWSFDQQTEAEVFYPEHFALVEVGKDYTVTRLIDNAVVQHSGRVISYANMDGDQDGSHEAFLLEVGSVIHKVEATALLSAVLVPQANAG